MYKAAYLTFLLAYVATSFAASDSATNSGVREWSLEGAPNFRDVGGYAAVGGHHIRWGRVFRSGDLSKLTPTDAFKVDTLRLAAVVDLRTSEERMQALSVWLNVPPDVYLSSKLTLAPLMRTILADASSPNGVRMGLLNFYAQMPKDYRTEYAALYHRIAAGDFPILVHCTAGKDRTGVAIALLLTAAGVPRQTVIEDYALTEKLLSPAAAKQRSVPVGVAVTAQTSLAGLPEESRRALWRSDPQYIESALDSMQREYGSIDGYLQSIGLSLLEIRALRTNLLD